MNGKNRNYRSMQFMRAVNPLVSSGAITPTEAVVIIEKYKNNEDAFIRALLDQIDADENMKAPIESFLTQD